MDKEYYINQYNELLKYLPESLKMPLYNVEAEIKQLVQEIRLRAGRPLSITVAGNQFFVSKSGSSMIPKSDTIMVTRLEVEECFLSLCNHSVYSHINEIKEGFIILKGGHRAGICGTATVKNGIVENLRDISSVNIRIAKEIKSCADGLISAYNGKGMLVCGGPGTGKTTLIRDLARQLADGKKGRFLKVAVIDSRGEIGAVSKGIPMIDLGKTCDIISACPKGKGIEMALRTLYPDVIVFDELGDMDEVDAIIQSMNSGVSVITSVHIGDLEELYLKKQTKKLLECGAIDSIIMCENKAGFSYKILKEKELRKTVYQRVTV